MLRLEIVRDPRLVTVANVMLSLNAKYQTSLIIVTHDPDLAAKTSHTYHLVDGRLSDSST